MKQMVNKIQADPFIWSAWIFILGFSLIRGFVIAETDVFWEARTGLDTVIHGTVPSAQAWNWIVPQSAWMPNSWLWNVILAGGYVAAGIPGLSAVSAVSAFTLLALSILLLKSWKVTSGWIFVTMLFEVATLAVWLSGRPQVWDYISVVGFMLINHWLLRKNAPYYLHFLAAFTVSAVWMNMHLTALLAVPFFAYSYWIESKNNSHRLLKTLGIAFAAGGGTLATPYFLDGVTQTLFVANESVSIQPEWMPATVMGQAAPIIYTVFIVAAAIVVLALRKKSWLFATAVIVTGTAAFITVRLAPFLSTLLLLGFFSHLYEGVTVPEKLRVPAVRASCIVASIFSASLLIGGVIFASNGSMNPSVIPLVNPQSFNAIPANSRVLTLQDGGSEMALLRPDVKTTIDGRNDVIGLKRLYEIGALYYSDDQSTVLRWVKKHQVDAVFVSQTDPASNIGKYLLAGGWKAEAATSGTVYLAPAT
jgi:hypothetical protein